ncbi:MAG: choice-of-anchor Q domain-containing protein [Planctomycetota bacterium]|jgi:hypothetical protein
MKEKATILTMLYVAFVIISTARGENIYFDVGSSCVNEDSSTFHESNTGLFYHTLPSGIIDWEYFSLGWSNLDDSAFLAIEVTITNIGGYNLKNVCVAQQFVFRCEPDGVGPAYGYKNDEHAWYRYPSKPNDDWWVRSYNVMGQDTLISMDRSVTDLPLSLQQDGHLATLLETDEVTLIPFGDLAAGESSTRNYYFITGAGGVCWRGHMVSTTPKPTTPVRFEIEGADRVVENGSARFKSIIYDDNGTGKNVTESTVWSVEPDTYASIDTNGVLLTNNIHTIQDVTIYASYTQDSVTFETEAIVQISFPRTLRVPSEYKTIQSSLDAAVNGDIVLVADGLYSGDGNRDLDFNGKSITLRSENGPESCIIDCNGTENDPHRGFYFHSGEDADSVLEGFTIINGYSKPSLPGGAISCNYSNPLISNCILINNVSGYSAGAMYNTLSSPTLIDCIFTDNSARRHGGGMYNSNESSPTLTNCKFLGNLAEDPLYGCGGGMFNIFNSNPTLINCAFNENRANYIGGGMYNDESSPTVNNCTFSRNASETNGGAIFNWLGNPMISSCTFNDNSTDYYGGAISSFGSASTLSNCLFIENIANYGGGMDIYRSSPTVTKCTFSRNLANYDGGAIFNYGDSHPRLASCTFSGNYANSKGGGIHNDGNILELISSTFVGNLAPFGAALSCDSRYSQYPSKLQVTSCIFWDFGNEIWNNNSSIISITYSDVQGGWPGEGNFEADPCFVEPGYWEPPLPPPPPPPCCPALMASYINTARNYFWFDGDYHLLPDSPCIDAGDPNYIADPNETDLDGRLRVFGGRIDMGAYEYSPAIPAEVRIIPRTINLASKGNRITCYMWLPEQYNVADIDHNSIVLEQHIKSEPLSVDEQKQVAIAKFSREELRGIISTGEVELTISGQLKDGTIFEATDVIKVINEVRRKN